MIQTAPPAPPGAGGRPCRPYPDWPSWPMIWVARSALSGITSPRSRRQGVLAGNGGLAALGKKAQDECCGVRIAHHVAGVAPLDRLLADRVDQLGVVMWPRSEAGVGENLGVRGAV